MPSLSTSVRGRYWVVSVTIATGGMGRAPYSNARAHRSWASRSAHVCRCRVPLSPAGFRSASRPPQPRPAAARQALRRAVLDAEGLRQLARLVHLHHDVAAPDQLAVDEQLWDRRPVGEGRELLADAGIGQDVHRREAASSACSAATVRAREAARGSVRGALHEEDHGVLGDRLLDRHADRVGLGGGGDRIELVDLELGCVGLPWVWGCAMGRRWGRGCWAT